MNKPTQIFFTPAQSDKLCAGVVLYWGQKEMRGFKLGFDGEYFAHLRAVILSEGRSPKSKDLLSAREILRLRRKRLRSG